MERSEFRGWSGRLFPALALALFLVHALLLVAVPHFSALPLASNLIEFILGLVIFAAAWSAAQHSAGFAKTFWRLQAAGFLLWITAQSLSTVYDNVLHWPLYQPWPSDILFFIWVVPALFSLFLDASPDSPAAPWEQWLDFAQVAILVAAAYLFLFEVPSHWQRPGLSFIGLTLLVEFGCDALLIGTFAARFWNGRRTLERALYGRMAIFFLLYAAAECPYLLLQAGDQLRSGTLWDLPWSFALAAGTFLIASAPVAGDEEVHSSDGPRKSSSLQLGGLLKLVPLAFPLAVLLMAAHFAEQQFALATGAVLASFACSSARVLLGERRQRQAAQALEERTALLKSVFEGTAEAIFVKDAEGRYLMVNEAVARFFGKPVNQIIGKTAFEVADFATARSLTKNDKNILENGESITVEFRVPDDATKRVFLTTRSPFRDATGKIIGIIGVARNITEFRVMEERLRQSQKMEAIGTLAGGVAHDFNNILMVISGYGSVLSDALTNDPKLRSHVEQIQKASERAAALTRQLLAFSRKQTIQPVQLNLNSVVSGIESLLHRLIGEHIRIRTQFANDLGTVIADAGQIEQVMLNLAVNARDAMPEGGQLVIETRNTEIAAEQVNDSNDAKAGSYVELIVSDTGTGMDAAVQSHLFEPFFTTKPPGKGTGLGLSTVYGIIRQANGSISFTSAPGVGTTFRILLPRVVSAQAVSANPKLPDTDFHGSETVLLVEDDPSVCELVRAVLTSYGYTVLGTRDPQDAETLCAKHGATIHLLLTDLIMPEMSGAELSKRLTALKPGMRVLFMSGYIDDSVMRGGISEKEVDFLQKPFSPRSLAQKVREVLDAATSLREKR